MTPKSNIFSPACAEIEGLKRLLAESLRSQQATIRLLNTPETENFDKGVPLEAAHQVQRWGSAHDSGKEPQDWFWLAGYLGGKALRSHLAGDVEKALHHCVSTAAAMRNWHAHIRSGETLMRPGIAPPLEADPAKTPPPPDPQTSEVRE